MKFEMALFYYTTFCRIVECSLDDWMIRELSKSIIELFGLALFKHVKCSTNIRSIFVIEPKYYLRIIYDYYYYYYTYDLTNII